MALCTVVATVTGASHNAEVTINGEDVNMPAAGGDQWSGALVVDLPPAGQAPLLVAVVGVATTWGVSITFTPPRANPNPYTKQNLSKKSPQLLDLV